MPLPAAVLGLKKCMLSNGIQLVGVEKDRPASERCQVDERAVPCSGAFQLRNEQSIV